MDPKWLQRLGIAATVLGIVANVASGIISEQQMKNTVADEVTKQITELIKESV